MSEKITFRELIEAIAEETNNSKQFTHDFIKDFVDVINNGLEDDGNVNIAGFGKFELRHMDERAGYNPQTEEKITIPAHNKVVFKPYKDLRELVNAPYAHLEPELIEEDNNQSEEEDVAEENTDAGNEDDFIPTAPPTSPETMDESPEDTKQADSDFEDPFGFSDDYTDDSTSAISDESATDSEQSGEESADSDEDPFDFAGDVSDDEAAEPEASEPTNKEEADDSGDVVEFNADADKESNEEETPHDINNFITPIEPSQSKEGEEPSDDEPAEPFAEETEPEVAEEDEKREGSPYAPGSEDETQSEDETILDAAEEEQEDEETSTPSFASQQPSRNQSSKTPIFVAAAVVLFLVAAGAWYFSGSSNDAPQMAASQPESTTDVAPQKNDQQPQTATANNQSSSDAAKQKQSEPEKTTSTAASSASANSTDLAIQEGQTLWSIAEEKYGNPRLWPWIYGNNGSLNDPDLIIAGSSLSVPLPSGPRNSLNATDSVGVAKGFISTYQWYKDNESDKAKNHLWAAKSYHDNIRDITDIQIDKADLVYANQSR